MAEKKWADISSGPTAGQIIAVLLQRLGGGPQVITAGDIGEMRSHPTKFTRGDNETSLIVEIEADC